MKIQILDTICENIIVNLFELIEREREREREREKTIKSKKWANLFFNEEMETMKI